MNNLRYLNPEQVGALLRTLLQAIGGVLIGKGLVSSGDWGLYTGAALVIVPTIWGFIARTDANLIKSAADVPAVQRVVAPGAPDLTNDSDHPKVTAA